MTAIDCCPSPVWTARTCLDRGPTGTRSSTATGHPLPPHEVLVELFADLVAEIDPHRSIGCTLDGHVSDPHFAPLWSTDPGVHAGEDGPLDLLEIGA